MRFALVKPTMAPSFSDLRGSTLQSPALLSAVATFLIVAYIVRRLVIRPKKLNMPVVGEAGGNMEDAIMEGTEKVSSFYYSLDQIAIMSLLLTFQLNSTLILHLFFQCHYH